MTSALAVAADAVAIFGGVMLAVWIRFDSGWVPMRFEGMPPRDMYWFGAGVATILFLLIFRSLNLYVRPQTGHFTEKVPRLIRAIFLGLLLSAALAFIIRTDQPFSRVATGIAFFTVTLLVLVERNILFQLERHWAKYQAAKKNVVVLGTDSLAVRLKRALEGEPRRRSRLVAFLSVSDGDPDPEIPADLVRGTVKDLPALLEEGNIDEVILANASSLPHEEMVKIIMHCEKAMASFHMIPDMFRLLTSTVEIQSVDGIPMMGVDKWPLDYFWNRMLKRIEDVGGACLGLVLSAPVVGLAALMIKATSPGPVFYKQERCGERGKTFSIYKLRTMRVEAEDETGPVWATEDDPRRTPAGAFLRRHNIDELPQFWNVLKGDMSLVGPRPERPHFVAQFKEDINRYMWRHTYQPGMTGWAQVNGFRGNTSIDERIKHDLFYLENWSPGLDFKILLKTLFSRENAY